MGRPKHALNVSEQERERIRELYVQGVRVVDIVWRVKRCESIVMRAVRGLKRPKPTRSRNVARDARMVEMYKQGLSFRAIGDVFALSATRVCEIVGILSGGRKPRPRLRTETSKLPRAKHSMPRLTRTQLTRRNALIERLWLDGVSYATLARRFMLAHERVRAIVRARLRRRDEAPGNAWRGPRIARPRPRRGG